MNKPVKLQGLRGMNDVLPADEALWNRFDEAVADTMASYGYGRIRTPILEQTALFVRGIGEVTDIVEKEMYSFTDALNGEQLTLRPENTAAVVRASIEHNLTYDGPKRLWYSGPMFRHERPQKGRYRQFHQIGAEVLGAPSAQVDAELILLCQRLWDSLGLPGLSLQINSLGQSEERAAHRNALIEYLTSHEAHLDADAKRRLHSNPLRILDSKNASVQEIVTDAPRLLDYLGPESLAHFEQLQTVLAGQNLQATVNHRLVRGLDYYNQTVFEWIGTDGLTVCGGGRYDPLIQMLGGKASYGCGFSVGVERALELMRQSDPQLANAPLPCDVYVVHHGEQTSQLAVTAAERLRDMGLNVVFHCGPGNMKAQFKRADASGAFVAVIVGESEVQADQVTVKNLRDRGAEQKSVVVTELTELVAQIISD